MKNKPFKLVIYERKARKAYMASDGRLEESSPDVRMKERRQMTEETKWIQVTG